MRRMRRIDFKRELLHGNTFFRSSSGANYQIKSLHHTYPSRLSTRCSFHTRSYQRRLERCEL